MKAFQVTVRLPHATHEFTAVANNATAALLLAWDRFSGNGAAQITIKGAA